jgi:hypothetical protein
MHKISTRICIILLGICLAIASCKVPAGISATENRSVPGSYESNRDSTNSAVLLWREFFTDRNLVNLIDTALQHNQELLTTFQEIEIARNDIRFRQGPLLPTVGARAGIGVEKVGRYTSQGAGDASVEITPGKLVPENLMDYTVAASANWEVDIWKKLHNAKKAAVTRYLSKIDMVIINREILTSLIDLLDEETLYKLGVKLGQTVLDDTIMFWKKETTERTVMEYIEKMICRYGQLGTYDERRMPNGEMAIVVRHRLGKNGSRFLAGYLQGGLKHTLDIDAIFEITDSSVKCQIPRRR